MSEKKESKPLLPNQVRIGLICFVGLFAILWYYGAIPWLFAYARCGGEPYVKTGGLVGSGTIYMPRDRGYGPSPFSHYICTSEGSIFTPTGYIKQELK